MSIQNYKLNGSIFEFVFDPEPVELKEAHTLVPMVLSHKQYFGLCFVDCNDMAVYRTHSRWLFTGGTTKEHTMTQEDFLRISDVKSLLDDDATFSKTY